MDALSTRALGTGYPGSPGLPMTNDPTLQDLSPEMLELLRYLMAMTGGDGSASAGGGLVSSGSPNFGGGGGGGAFPSALDSCLNGFLGAGNGNSGGFQGSPFGGSGGLGGNYNGNGSGSYVSGGRDGYVPGGFSADGRGGAVGGSARGESAVAWAESQLGVSEANNPGTVRGYSNGNWQAWCADFVSKSFEKTGGSPFGHQSSVAGILSWGKANDRFTSAAQAAKNPGSLQIGDIATWKADGKSHVGLVTGVNKNGTFTTIEGNTSDKVGRRTHAFSERGLTGFVRATKTELAGSSTAGKSGTQKSGAGSASSAASKGSSASSASKGSSGSGGSGSSSSSGSKK